MIIPQKEIKKFQTEILDWYKKNQRDLPWRKTRDPYRILVSEVMAQQTQLSRVIPKYEAWVKEFPTIDALAKAKVSDVLRLWSGLGYNRRALYLKRFAEKLVDHPGDRRSIGSPWDSIAALQNDTNKMIAVLKTLPGIGEYTARAIVCFGFNQQVALVDTNVRKVIFVRFGACHYEGSKMTKQSQTHQKDCRASLSMTNRELQEIADQLLPVGKAYEWNQALMDYSAVMLKKEKLPIPKQSKFKGSYRYFRGLVLKTLLEKKQITDRELDVLLTHHAFPQDKQKETLLDELVSEGFICKLGEVIVLA